MIFKETPDKWYPNGFWLSDNKLFAIGIIGELFKRLKLQVLHKGNKEFDDWFVMQEYVTYELFLLDKLFDKIIENLLSLDKYIENWKIVLEHLPERKEKYLEDSKETFCIEAKKQDSFETMNNLNDE